MSRFKKTEYPGWEYYDAIDQWCHLPSKVWATEPYLITNTGIPEDAFDVPPTMPRLGAQEFAEVGMMAVPVEAMPAQGELFPLSPAKEAALENLMQADSLGLLAGDNVTLPKHYARFKIEPIRFVTENGLSFLQGNIIKYVLRYDAKNGMEDLKKAKRYLEMLIKFTEGDEDWWKA